MASNVGGKAEQKVEDIVARPRRVIGYDDAVRSGVGQFLSTGTVCMDALAQRLSVSRATLYRVVPGRDRLLGDVVWRQAMVLFAHARTMCTDQGGERILSILRVFGQNLLSAPSFQQFVTGEPDTALRVLWTPAGDVHERFVQLNHTLIQEAIASGGMVPPFAVLDMAYVLARIYESVWYADLMAGRAPNLDLADATARAVLQLSETPVSRPTKPVP